jgi:hypothetical protein
MDWDAYTKRFREAMEEPPKDHTGYGRPYTYNSGEPVFPRREKPRRHEIDPRDRWCKVCGKTEHELKEAYFRELMENRVPLSQACPGEPANAPQCVMGHGPMKADRRWVPRADLGPFNRWYCTQCRFKVMDAEEIREVNQSN